jgi:hypothetical protein
MVDMWLGRNFMKLYDGHGNLICLVICGFFQLVSSLFLVVSSQCPVSALYPLHGFIEGIT